MDDTMVVMKAVNGFIVRLRWVMPDSRVVLSLYLSLMRAYLSISKKSSAPWLKLPR